MFLLLFSCTTIDTTLNKSNESCDPVVWYADADGDGIGSGEALADCEQPSGHVGETGDCDDGNAAIFPGADEICNGVDDDCDGDVDGGAIDAPTWFSDADGDTFGDADSAQTACEQAAGTVADDTDCDDADDTIHPGASEFCNGIDDDCNGTPDNDPIDPITWYLDADGDGWGVPEPTVDACEMPSGYADNPDDCDDGDATLTEVCAGGPIVTTSACSGTVYSTVDHNATEPELHMFSVYEADGGHGGPPGNIHVDIQRATQMTLVLSSYENVHWTVTAVPGAQIDRVLLNGYHSQAVTLPAGVPSEVRTYDQTSSNFGGWCGYSLPYNGGGCDTNQIIGGVEAHTQLNMASFTGCYHGTDFTLQ